MKNIDEAIKHAEEVAEKKYIEAMLYHANPDDGQLDSCIECAKEHEQLVKWLKEYKWYKENYDKLCNAIYKFSDIFMPKYFISDSCNGTQACEILLEMIAEKFAPKPPRPTLKEKIKKLIAKW